jgi:hypothetical protein
VPTVFQLVGYSHLPELGRVRIYVRAADPLAREKDVFIQVCPGRFGFDGAPLQVRRAPTALAARVRAHFLKSEADEDDPADELFEAAMPSGDLRTRPPAAGSRVRAAAL